MIRAMAAAIFERSRLKALLQQRRRPPETPILVQLYQPRKSAAGGAAAVGSCVGLCVGFCVCVLDRFLRKPVPCLVSRSTVCVWVWKKRASVCVDLCELL